MGKAIYIKSKIDGNEYCKTNGQFTRHLKNNNLTYHNYYEKYVTGIEMKCRCEKPLTFYQPTETYANSCGSPKCIGELISETKANWTDDQRVSDSLNKKKWASSRTKEDKEKSRELRKQTNRERYGVDYTTQSTQMMDKSKITKKERHGDEFYSNPTLTSKSWQEKSVTDIESITTKRQLTCLEKYGVVSPFLLPDVRKKSAIGNSVGREFTLPSGKIIRVRGYEDVTIIKLLDQYAENELVVDDTLSKYNLPIFKYSDNRKHILRYYPDIYIPKENKIIEVKGRWWWDGNGLEKYTDRLKKNLKKRHSVLNAGYQYEVWLFEDRKNFRILKNDADFNPQ
jgi:hypothetical protein